MTEQLPSTSYIFVDRRKSGKGKSIPNRQRLLRRIKDAIRDSKPQDIDAGGVKNLSGTNQTNPVKVAKSSLREPTIHYKSGTGDHEIVLIGNDRFERGDKFPLDDGEGDGEGSGNGAGQGEDGEDDFIVSVSRDEFFDVFFEDCELPDLLDTHAKELPEFVPKHAGFQKNGNPGQLSVKRSFKNSYARRKALTLNSREELRELEAELELLMAETNESKMVDNDAWFKQVQEVSIKIQDLKDKISNVPFFDELDLRYTKKEKVQIKSADAVLVLLMDISGSMDEDKKRTARKFFVLQYRFIKRKYDGTDLVFVSHTESAKEVTEEEFFTQRVNGGTMVSPAYVLINKILKDRYDPTLTNIYLTQASDGDNWDSDNADVIKELEENGLLAKLRHMSYAQVGNDRNGSLYSSRPSLWNVLNSISVGNKKLSMVKIGSDNEVFDAFQKIYKKKA